MIRLTLSLFSTFSMIRFLFQNNWPTNGAVVPHSLCCRDCGWGAVEHGYLKQARFISWLCPWWPWHPGGTMGEYRLRTVVWTLLCGHLEESSRISPVTGQPRVLPHVCSECGSPALSLWPWCTLSCSCLTRCTAAGGCQEGPHQDRNLGFKG
jgi:hypothetical protein